MCSWGLVKWRTCSSVNQSRAIVKDSKSSYDWSLVHSIKNCFFKLATEVKQVPECQHIL